MDSDTSDTEKIPRAAILAEEGREKLRNFMPKIALKKFEEAIKTAEGKLARELPFLCIWAELMTLGNTDSESLKIVGNKISKMGETERTEAIYFFIKGLYEAKMLRSNEAEKSFTHAVILDPDFLEAKRELKALKLRLQKGA